MTNSAPTRRLLPCVAALGLLAAAPIAHAAVISEPYVWTNAVIGGGGFMPGIVFHPTAPGLAYIRADMAGAYRLDPATRRWLPIMDFYDSYDNAGVESIAVDPRDPKWVFMLNGTMTQDFDWNPKPTHRLLRSADQGATWEKIDVPFRCGGNEGGRSLGERLVVDPHLGTTLFAGSRQKGLLTSIDRGSTWKQVTTFPVSDTTSGLWPNIGVGFVIFDPRTGTDGSATRTIYAGVATPGTNLYRSTDGGATWAAVPGQPTKTDPTARGEARDMLPHHAVLAANGFLYVTYTDRPGPDTGDGEVYKLDTATGAWTRITPPKGKAGGTAGLAVHPTDGNIVMVSTTGNYQPDNEVFRSVDGGATWKPVKATGVRDASPTPYLTWGGTTAGMGNWIEDLEIDPSNPDRVLYVTGATVWGCDDISNLDADRPTHWRPRVEGLEECVVFDLVSPPSGPRLLSAIPDVGGFVHDDPAESPKAGMLKPTYGTQTSVDVAQLDPKQMVRVGRWTDWSKYPAVDHVSGAWSGDAGATWTSFTTPAEAKNSGRVTITANGSAIVWSMEGTRPYRSTDHGQTWTPCAGITGQVSPAADRVDGTAVYALNTAWGGPATVYHSADGGANFTAVGVLPAAPTDGRVRPMPGAAGRLYVGSKGGLLRSLDGGATFTSVNPLVSEATSVGFGAPAPGSVTPAIFITGTLGGAEAGTYGIFRSDDDGGSWVRCDDDQHRWGGGFVIGDPRTYGRFYFGAGGRGIVLGDRAASPVPDPQSP